MSAPEAWHVTRTLRAMEALAVRPRSAPELAEALGVHVRTARRILTRLESDGYVSGTGDRGRRYRPTMRIVALAGLVVEGAELTQIALPHIQALWEKLGRSCHLCVPSYLYALCLVHQTASAGAGCRPHLRELVPCHCTAAGKALLAWRGSWRDAVLAQRLESFTERTTTGPESLRRELGRTTARGYAIEDREYEADTRGIAAPVFGPRGEALAAIGVVAPVAHLPAEQYREVAEKVMDAAAALSSALGSDASSGRRDSPRSVDPARAA